MKLTRQIVERFKKMKKNRLHIKKILLLVAVLILGVLLIERFIHQGTVLGYQVRKNTVETAQQSADTNKQKTSYACEQTPEKKVADILGEAVVRVGGSFADRSKPQFMSLCTYRTNTKPARIVTIVIHDEADKQVAESAVKKVSERSGVSEVSLGDKAYFAKDARQLTVQKAKRIITITVSQPTDSSTTPNEEAVTKIAKLIGV